LFPSTPPVRGWWSCAISFYAFNPFIAFCVLFFWYGLRGRAVEVVYYGQVVTPDQADGGVLGLFAFSWSMRRVVDEVGAPAL